MCVASLLLAIDGAFAVSVNMKSCGTRSEEVYIHLVV